MTPNATIVQLFLAASSPIAAAITCSTPRPNTRHDMTKLNTRSVRTAVDPKFVFNSA